MTLTKLLAGTLALVLVAGMTSPAFAGMTGASIEITKTTIGGDGEFLFDIEPKITTSGNCSITTQGGTGTCTIMIVGPAQYTITEISPLGWSPVSAICDDDIDPGPGVTIDFPSPDIKFCEFVNEIDVKVAGELLPLNTSALMIAGLSTSAVWMVPAIAGLAGAGVYLVKFRANKE